MYSLFFDGACRGNPGPASFGGVIYNEKGEELDTFKSYIGMATNNVAEYCGLLGGLNRCRDLNIKHLSVYGDSNLVIQQVQGKWKVKHPKLKAYINKFSKLSRFSLLLPFLMYIGIRINEPMSLRMKHSMRYSVQQSSE